MGSKIILTQNILNIGLLNRSIGIIKDIVCIDRSLPPTLPIFVQCNFGNLHVEINFFLRDKSRKGWFPIFSVIYRSYILSKHQSTFIENTNKQLPLKLYWAWIAHKNQGMMIPSNIISEMTNKEMEYRYLCIIMSYVK